MAEAAVSEARAAALRVRYDGHHEPNFAATSRCNLLLRLLQLLQQAICSLLQLHQIHLAMGANAYHSLVPSSFPQRLQQLRRFVCHTWQVHLSENDNLRLAGKELRVQSELPIDALKVANRIFALPIH
mmetsp:Transcript_34186/g.65831  ORF Transcript_34186/g.65831 Transcript_34186/m.65831 type:complete len:128 (+) Transcript_34186:85-468(+)